MQPTTKGMAAIRANVRIFGRDSEPFASPFVVAMFIRPTNTAEALRSTCDTYDLRVTFLTGLGVEKLENLAGALGADARYLAQIGDRRPFDLLQGSEMVQQSPFARGADAGNFLQSGLSNVLLPQFAMRPDDEAVGLVAQ